MAMRVKDTRGMVFMDDEDGYYFVDAAIALRLVG